MARGRQKVSIIGAGHVGATAAHWALTKELADIVLIDVLEGLTKGKALDLLQSTPMAGADLRIVGGDRYDALEDSDIVVITAGFPRKPGMSRDDLLAKNTEIVRNISEKVCTYCPEAVMIVVTNPLDAMAYVAKHYTGFERARVIGMAGVLDSARFRTFVAAELNVSVQDVHAFVLGGHGDTMVPMIRYCSVAGIPLTELLSEDRIDAIVKRTQNGGAEIVELLQSGSAYYAPSAAIIEMAEAILRDKKRILPCSVYLEGEFGVEGCYFGVLAKLGADGVEQVIELDLNEEERKEVNKSIEHVKELTKALKLGK